MLNRFANKAAIRFVQSDKYLFLEVVKVLFGTVEVCIITDTVLCFFFSLSVQKKGKVWLA